MSSSTSAGESSTPGRAHERVGLGRGEAEVLGADLEELAAGPQAGERERWIGARGDREPGARREALDEGRDEPMDGRLIDQVVVVEHQDRAVSGRCDAVEDAGQGELGIEGLGVERRRCPPFHPPGAAVAAAR